MEKTQLGRFGEDMAADYLAKQGYEVLQRNYRCPYGEVDILAHHEGYLVFVEVKARSSSYFGRPCEAVNAKKRAKLIQCAQNYLSCNSIECGVRFDVVEVFLAKKGGSLQAADIHLISNAFC